MNSDSMIEPVQNISTFADVDQNCTVFDKTTGGLCGETESLKIIDEFQKLYETRIENVDRELENEYDQVCMKLEISREWIRNLREQNVMLVKTVEDLEEAASDRVKLLEQKLKQSSMILSESMINSNHTEKTIHMLSNRVSNLEKDDTSMRRKLEFLQSDIRGLIELIRRAAQENHWSLDGIEFFEIQLSDIPIPNDCTCRQEETNYKRMRSLELQIEHFQENKKMMAAYQKELEDKLADLNKKLESKEDTIKQYVGQLQNFSNNLKKHAKFADQITSNSFASDQQTFDIVIMADIVENMFTEKDLETKCLQQRSCVAQSNNLGIVARDTNTNLNNLKVQLNEKCKAIQEIQQQMINLNKESLEKQDALTAELINKREIVTALQKQIAVLQEHCRCTNMQIDFKEDIIKEMRKEFKRAIAKSLYFNVSSCIRDCYNRLAIGTQEMESFCKLLEKISEPKVLSARHKNDMSLLQSCIESTINHEKITESLPVMKTNNLMIKAKKVNVHKHLHGIDKKILKYTTKLPLTNRNSKSLSCKNTDVLKKSDNSNDV